MKIKNSLSITIIYIISSIALWFLVIGVSWGIYYLQWPYNEFNAQLKIFKWMYHTTDIYLPLITIIAVILTIASYRKKEQFIYKGFLYSFIYSGLITILYFIFRDV